MITYTPEEIEEARLEAIASHKNDNEAVAATIVDHRPGTFSFHEALDRTSIVMDTVGGHILEHEAILRDPEAFRLAHEAHSALFNLYQYLGSKHL